MDSSTVSNIVNLIQRQLLPTLNYNGATLKLNLLLYSRREWLQISRPSQAYLIFVIIPIQAQQLRLRYSQYTIEMILSSV